MSASQDARFRALCDVHDAVAARPLPDGTLALTARDKSGKLAGAELVDDAGRALPLDETIRRLGAVRQAALEQAEAATDQLVAHLAIASVVNPNAVNLSDVHETTGVARQTLYNRLKALDLSKALPRPGRKRRATPRPTSTSEATTAAAANGSSKSKSKAA